MTIWEIHEKIRLDAASHIWDSMRGGDLFGDVVGSKLRDVRLAMRAMKDEIIGEVEKDGSL